MKQEIMFVFLCSIKFRTTTNRAEVDSGKTGNVVYTFGNYAAMSSEPRNSQEISIKMADLNDGTKWINEQTKYMTVSAQDDGQLVAERIFNVGREISKKILRDENKSMVDDQLILSHCDVMSHENVRCLGKIFIGGRTDKLDQKSCIFIGFDENKSRIVQLDLSKLRLSVQIFPGEICIISGNNPRGKIFFVNEIYSERILENCSVPSVKELTQPLHMVIASFPFSSDDALRFKYFEKLLENCKNNKPDVLILTGAFLSTKSELIVNAALEIDQHFHKMLSGVSEIVGADTKVIIVSSVDDINSSACYPTRPYKLKKLRPYPNLFLAPDPSIIEINGIQIGLSSVDITQQLADAEFCV